MRHDEFTNDLRETFDDKLRGSGEEPPIIKCKICHLKAPAASIKSSICEMCFEEDFWEWHAQQLDQ